MKHQIVDQMKRGLSLEGCLAAIDQMPVAILIKDEQLKFRAINRRFAALLPREADELIGLTVWDLYPDMAEHFEMRERRVLETGVEQFYQETLANGDGVLRNYQTHITRIDGGTAGKFVCISLTDVTDLNHARLRAMQSDRLKSEFLANMSHEIRTPLNGVLGMAELLRHSELSDRQRSLADIISSSGVQLLRILDDVLDFSRIEAGQMTLAPELLNLEKVVDDVVTLLAPKAAEKGLDLIAHIRPSAPQKLWLDPARLSQILSNLVGNAIKFTDQGHILIDIGVSNGRTMIVVEDTGIGIPEEEQKEIFKKFVRSRMKESQSRGGAGLGLTISASLVHLMKGEIGVETTDNGGARFWFSLPIAPRSPLHRRDGAAVGVIDRNDLRAGATADRLARWGYRPHRLAPGDPGEGLPIVIIGPEDVQKAPARGPSQGAMILLAPLSDDDRLEACEDPLIRKASSPIRGAELETILQELVPQVAR